MTLEMPPSLKIRGLVAIFLSFVLLAFTGCGSPRSDALATLRKVGNERLRDEAAWLYKDVFAARAPAFTNVRSAQWPPSFQRFTPLHVGAFADGFALALNEKGDLESGLYVVPLHMDRTPAATAHASFERLDDGVFWYVFTR